MGLFDKLTKQAERAIEATQQKIETAQAAANNAATSLTAEDIASNLRSRFEGGNPEKDAEDTRDYTPMEVLRHRQHECIPVRDCDRFQEPISQLQGDTAEVELKRLPKNQHYNVDGLAVLTLDGNVLGKVPQYTVDRVGCKAGKRVAEIARPQYHGESGTWLFLPKLQSEIAHEVEAESLKLWMNIGEEKWLGGDIGERADYSEVEILAREADGKKPVYSLLGDGVQLLEFRPRMKYYGEIANRAKHKPRMAIAESRVSEYGPYYRVGVYF